MSSFVKRYLNKWWTTLWCVLIIYWYSWMVSTNSTTKIYMWKISLPPLKVNHPETVSKGQCSKNSKPRNYNNILWRKYNTSVIKFPRSSKNRQEIFLTILICVQLGTHISSRVVFFLHWRIQETKILVWCYL